MSHRRYTEYDWLKKNNTSYYTVSPTQKTPHKAIFSFPPKNLAKSAIQVKA